MKLTSIGAFAGAGGSQFYADPVVFEVVSTNVDKVAIIVHQRGRHQRTSLSLRAPTRRTVSIAMVSLC
jgi:hypothetical protein